MVHIEGRDFQRCVLQQHHPARVRRGEGQGLGAKAATMIIAEESYETTQPTIDSNIVKLKSSGADVFVNITTPKFAAQAIKKMGEVQWKPLHLLNNVSASIGAVMKPAGFDAGQGIISSAYLKDTSDPQWKNDAGMKAFDEFLTKHFPEGNRVDANVMYGYTVAQGLVHVLKQCGDNLTRENVMKQAASLDMTLPMSLPGVNIKTSADDFFPIEREKLARFDGKTWEPIGPVISAGLAKTN